MTDLGIFGPDFAGKTFPGKSPSERTPKVNGSYAFRPDLVRKALLWMAGVAGKSLYLAGPAGSGKTSLAEQVAARLGWGCTTLSCNNRTEKADIVGYVGLENGATKFLPGPLVRAMKLGEMIIFDEGDALPPSISIVLNRVLEGAPLTIVETGQIIEPHPDFRVAFTGNTQGRGDSTGNFRARQVQDAAVLDRFLFVEVDYPSDKEEDKILGGVCPALPEDVRSLLINLAGETRSAYKAGELSAPISTRGLIRISQVITSGVFTHQPDPIWASIQFSFTDGLSPDEREGVQKMYSIVRK